MRVHLEIEMFEGRRGRHPVAALGSFFGRDEKLVAMAVVIGKYLCGKAHVVLLEDWQACDRRIISVASVCP
jgi:hypothetical protein